MTQYGECCLAHGYTNPCPACRASELNTELAATQAANSGLAKERDELRAIINKVHGAIGEAPQSDDASLPGEIAATLQEFRQVASERDELRGKLREAQQALATDVAGILSESARRQDAEAKLAAEVELNGILSRERDAAEANLAQAEKEREKLRAKLNTAMAREAFFRERLRWIEAEPIRRGAKRNLAVCMGVMASIALKDATDHAADTWLAAQKAAGWKEVLDLSLVLSVDEFYRILGDRRNALEAQK